MAQKPLQRDRPEDASVRPAREPLLGLERRLQPVGPVAIGDDARQVVVPMSHCLADGIKPVFRVRTATGRTVVAPAEVEVA